MASYETNRSFSDRFIPQVQRELGSIVIGVASRDDDVNRATDLVVLRYGDTRVAVRIRRNEFLYRYGDEFTIRSAIPHGKTELQKILEGWGDYLFYGYADKHADYLCAWAIARLSVFRSWVASEAIKNNGQIPGEVKKNTDGSSDFTAFKWLNLPIDFVVAHSGIPILVPVKPMFAIAPPKTDSQMSFGFKV